MTKKLYIEQREAYTPSNIKLIFILESPPAGPAYFYNSNGKTSELLFRAFMEVLGFSPSTKKEGLEHFAEQGWLIIDPIYEPVNKLPDKKANALILENYPNFKQDLLSLNPDKTIPLILIKATVLKILGDLLVTDGFTVLNHTMTIPFPLHYHSQEFIRRIKSLLKNTV